MFVYGFFFGCVLQLCVEVLNQIGIIGNEWLWLEKVWFVMFVVDWQLGESELFEVLEDLKWILVDVVYDLDFFVLFECDLKLFVGKVCSDVKEEVLLLMMVCVGELIVLVEQVGFVLFVWFVRGE